MSNPTQAAVCARCIKPMVVGEQYKVGRYTYGDCCVLKVKPDFFEPERVQK